MVYSRNETIKVKNKVFTVGDTIKITDDECEFKGMVGYIFEIRTDEDKESTNEGDTELLCKFDIEQDYNIRVLKALEKVWQHPIDLYDFAFDYLILNPDYVDVIN